MATKTKAKPAKKSKKVEEVVEEVEEDIELDEDDVEPDTDDDDVELEDLEADVEEDDEKPSKKKQDEVEFGVSDLCKYLTKKTGREVKPRELRTLIRKMAREDNARVDREITPGNRTRYNWPGGLAHPEVKRIIKAVTGGEMEADKQEKLAALKENKAKKTAAKSKASKKSKKTKKTAPVEEVDEDEEIEEIDLDEDED